MNHKGIYKTKSGHYEVHVSNVDGISYCAGKSKSLVGALSFQRRMIKEISNKKIKLTKLYSFLSKPWVDIKYFQNPKNT